MSRRKKLRILIPVVILLFLAAYAKHRFIDGKFPVSGSLQSRDADEISGITASVINKDIYYVHNDSGDTSRFFAIKPSGELVSTINYSWGKRTVDEEDCEDIATGPGPVKGKSYVYIADIGDNASRAEAVSVHRVMERTSFATEKTVFALNQPVYLQYPDGPKDAETLMIDPVDRLMYIVTKRRDSVTVYTTTLKYKVGDTVMLTKRCRLFFDGIKPFKWITGGDISKDGQQVLLKSYQKVYYWQRKDNEPIWETLKRKPKELPYKQERIGEAIGFTADGKGYLTTSEGVFAPIYYYKTPGYFGL